MMKLFLLTVLSFCSYLGSGIFNNALASNVSLHNTPAYIQHELKPIPNSFQLAKTTFLPDIEDSELGFPDKKLPGDVDIENCNGYSTGTCPTKAVCERCPFDGSKIKIIGCASNWTLTGSACIPNSCTAISSSYKDSIPDDNICTNFTEYSKTCYKNCRAVSCSGYTVSCTTKPEHATALAKCPDCQNTSNSKCGTDICKVTACETKYKINANATGCILKDDTCPNGYYKTCEAGTQGDPKYTEMGTACYQCKPNKQPWEICAEKINASYPGYGILSSTSVPAQGKGYVVVKDLTLSKLPGNVIYGAQHFTSIPECASLNPTLNIETKEYTTENYQKFVNKFDNFHFEDVNFNYNNSISDYFYPIYLNPSSGTTSKIKNVNYTFSGSKEPFSELITFPSDRLTNTYSVQLDIEGFFKVQDFSFIKDYAAGLPRIRAIRPWTVVNIRPGANVEFPGMDMASNLLIDNATVKVYRIATSGNRVTDTGLTMKNNAKLYLTNELHLESCVSLTYGSAIYSPLIEAYYAFYDKIKIYKDSSSNYYKWNPQTGSTSVYGTLDKS